MLKKDVQYYMNLPYRYTIYPGEEGGYVIEIPELPGCISQGESIEEALVMIEDAKKGWIEVALSSGLEISEPFSREIEDYSGKFNVRVPKSLHKTLSENAKKENISLNQLIIYHLSRSLGQSR